MARQLQKEESGLFQPTQPAPPSPLGTDSVDRDERALEGGQPGNAAPALVPQREREELARSIHRAAGESFNVPVLNKGSSTLHQHEEEYSLELPEQNAPIFASYNDRIRPLLDAVDSLRDLMITKEVDIQLPTIVVVGDQSSGKSSVLESLAGINLPRGLGICTRMRLQALDKGISSTPLTLEVRKNGVPDLTMVDLPGITRVPVHGCHRWWTSPGERTLAVVTKSDKAPEGLLEKVTADDVNIGLGYVCVRNRIGDESYEEARVEEAKLFETHPMLSKIDKSIVGVPVLAQKAGMPKKMSSLSEAMTVFMQIIGSAKESLRKILLRGEFDEYPDEKKMHCTARSPFRRAGHNLIAKMKERSVNWVMEIVEMEKQTDYTCNPEYLSDWNKLMGQQDFFMKEQAFDMKMRMTAYWKIVLRRLVDCMALHLQLSVSKLVNKEFEKEIVDELMGAGGGIERMLDESPSVNAKRLKINKSIELLQKAKEVVANHGLDWYLC
uniref:GED domain-containing protein n=1 Tax=Fagus sylvatica TaxID=28930 RepID=A0A2N9GCL2_FAGSY